MVYCISLIYILLQYCQTNRYNTNSLQTQDTMPIRLSTVCVRISCVLVFTCVAVADIQRVGQKVRLLDFVCAWLNLGKHKESIRGGGGDAGGLDHRHRASGEWRVVVTPGSRLPLSSFTVPEIKPLLPPMKVLPVSSSPVFRTTGILLSSPSFVVSL